MSPRRRHVSELCRVIVCCVAGPWWGGCQQARLERPAVGTSTHRFVTPIAGEVDAKPVWPTENQPPVEVVQPAEPIEPLAQPIYPAGARGRQNVPMTVGVRIVIDERGRVAEMRHSPLALTTHGPLAEEFRAAVESALSLWRFEPAQRQRMTPKEGGPAGRYWHVTRLGPSTDSRDVQFTFTASGEVVPMRSSDFDVRFHRWAGAYGHE